jgi:hypothetical protein
MATSMWLSKPSVSSWPSQVLACHRTHGFIHGLVVVGGGHDQVAARDQVVVAHIVVMDQRAARRFDDAHATALAHALVTRSPEIQAGSSSSSAITSTECSSSIMRAQW